jgi:hypothetical protein
LARRPLYRGPLGFGRALRHRLARPALQASISGNALSIFLSFYLSIFLSFYLFVMPLGAILQRSELSCFGKVSGAPRQSCEKPSSSVSPIAQHPQEHADRFWRLAYLDRILIASYADEGVSLLMRAERADVFNLNVAFSPAPVSYHDPVFTHLY